jgi:phosphate transport system substrate-binding protein
MLLLLGASCDLGEDPDPREHRPRTFPLVSRAPAWDPAEPVVAEVDPHAAAPAPRDESRPPATAMAPRPLCVALGQNAADAIDAELQHGFTALPPGRETTFVAHTDRDAIELLLLGRADFAVVGSQLSARDQQAGLQQTRLGVELFALAVAPDAPLRSLTRQQVRQILTGQVADWSQLGIAGDKIVVVAPADRGRADRAARALIPGDNFADTVVRVASNRHVADQILQHPGAIGIVTVGGEQVAGMKLLAIDWCPPTAEAFGYGTYPFGVPLHLVTPGRPVGDAVRFFDYLRSDAARARLATKVCLL